MTTVDAWKAWVDAPNGRPERRRLIVQIISVLHLNYGRWERYEAAVEHFQFFSAVPEQAGESIGEAFKIAQANDWAPSKVRKAVS